MSGRSLSQEMFLAKPKMAGMTLVELMIAMLVSAILSVGLLMLLRGLHANFRTQMASARLNDDARFALDIVGYAIANAGSNPNNPAEHRFPFPQVPGASSLTVQYYSDAGCLGGNLGDWLTVTFSLSGNQLERNCGSPQPLIGDNQPQQFGTLVKNLSFLYGVDADNDFSIGQGEWKSAITSEELPQIMAVRVNLTLAAPLPSPTAPGTPGQQELSRNYILTVPIKSRAYLTD